MPKILINATREYEQENGSWGGKEFVPCDIDNLQPFTTTCQFWKHTNPRQWITYNVVVHIEEVDPLQVLHITYNRDNNYHLQDHGINLDDDIAWGTHSLTLQQGENFGPSTWTGHGEAPCEGPGWTSIGILGERRRETTTRLQRNQAEFREMLLARDGSCAVTGEACHDVLEAAHIVAARDGGQEVPENGILLRADLHRLYDANPPRFEISPQTGQIMTLDGFDYNGFALNGTPIDDAILQRVGEALHLRQQIMG